MKRRIAVCGSIVLALSALAAIGLAQNGQRSHEQPGSLAERLSALRRTVETDPGAADGAAQQRSVLAPVQSGADPASSRQPAFREPAETESQDRPRRPRLLSTLDPLNLLSLGDGDPAEAPRQSTSSAPRSRLDSHARTDVRREPSSFGAPTAAHQQADPNVDRTPQVRRSPLAHRAEEALPPSESEPTRPGNSAVGPAASESMSLPSLDRPVSSRLSAVSRDQSHHESESTSNLTPQEQSLEAARASLLPDASAASESEPEDESAATSARYSTSGETEGRYAQQEPDDALEPAEPIMPADVLPQQAEPTEATPADADRDLAGMSQDLSPATGEISAADPVDTVSPSPSDTSPSTGAAAGQVLSSDEAPAVSWEVTGPRQIIIGRESTFEVRLQNEGAHPAERLVARIDVPGSAEIVSAEATHGVGQRVEDGATSAVLEWRINQLSAMGEAVLKLRIVPRTNQTMNMQVSVRAEPRAALARVEVLEPKLKLSLEGPTDVLYGEARSYRIVVTNPGTGPAENVVVLFTPPGQEEDSAQKHSIGLLEPGQSKTLDVEVTPEKAGDAAMKALASADGDIRDQAERRVLVRKPELVVDARGPRTTYAGTVATYYFRVQNTGDAVANDVSVAANLPLGAEFIRATDDRKLEPEMEKNNVGWKVGSLSPGEEFYIELKCAVNWAGDNTVEIAAQAAEGELQHSKSVTTHVVALADLKLEVADPKGPVAVGKEAVYEVRIRNRGSNTAEQVNVAALFSEGIDPVGVEGGQHTIDNGRVAFRTIESLPAGREIIFKIRAVAKQPGTHVFRAEVLCRELETKLAAEETTRYYLDEAGAGTGGGFQAAAREEQFDVQ